MCITLIHRAPGFKKGILGDRCLYNVFFHCIYYSYLVGSERDREKEAMLGLHILGAILPVDTLVRTELGKPTHFLF